MASTPEAQGPRAGQGRLAGRVAIVTGASRGIGKDLAEAFAREGASVAVAARTEKVWAEYMPGTIFETVEEIRKAGGRAIPVRCDVSVPEDLDRLVDTVHAEFGPIDLLVNNAAITIPGRPPKPGSEQAATPRPARARPSAGPISFVDFPLYGFRSHFEVNVFAAYRLMQLVLPDMIAARRGAIINISSSASEHPGEGPYGPWKGNHLAYGASKSALEHLTQSVAYEMAQYGIVANTLSPSLPVPTPGNVWVGADLSRTTSLEEFSEAAIRLANETPSGITGRRSYNLDILHPERDRKGWVG